MELDEELLRMVMRRARKIEISLLFLGTGKRFHRLHKLKEIAGKAAVTPDAAGLFFP